jgi:Mg2+/Co2+ transporter CorC
MLPDLEEKQLLRFSQSFEKALGDIPDEYDKNSEKDVRDFQDFFGNWGQYIVAQVSANHS